MTGPAEENNPIQIGSINFEKISGSQVELGDVNIQVQARDIVGRDKIIHIYQATPPQPVNEEVLAKARQRLAEIPTDHLPNPAPLPPGSRLNLRRNPHFVGREDNLRALASALKSGQTIAIVATGVGGIGKTQLAVEFAHRYGPYFQGGVFWLNFADPALITTEIAECGQSDHLNLAPGFDKLDLAEQIRRVSAAWHSPLPRLLIFDNCEEETLFQQWCPASGGCRILITSRRASWESVLDVWSLPLGVLSRSESIALLRKYHSDLPPDDPTLKAIAEELGDLPLALDLAGNFLKTYKRTVSPSAYLGQLGDKKLLEHPSLQGRGTRFSPTGHERHVAKTFALSYRQLKPEAPTDALALALLVRAACFAPGEPIPWTLLVTAVEIDQAEPEAVLTLEDALHRLVELGLLSSPDEESFLLHRLLAHFVRQVSVDTSEAQAAVETAILQAVSERGDQAGHLANMLPLQAHLRFVTDAALNREDEQAARLSNWSGYYLKQIGDYAAARPYYERDLAIYEQGLGPEHPDTARSLNNLAELLREQGDYAAARPYLERALAIREKALGPEHPATAISLNNLALLLQAQGDYAAARPYFERALVISEKALGPAHPVTATSLDNLAGLLHDQGDYAAAWPYYERALAIWEKMLGPEHPVTATSLNNLAGLLYAQGDYTAARPYYERALAIREKMLGPEHPATAGSLNNLASLLKAQGDTAAARPYLERALAIREKALGPAHPATAQSLNNLALLLQAQGDTAAAWPYYERALAIWEKALGPAHPDTATSLNNLAGLLHDQGDYAAAWPYYERALAICEKALGPAHPDTATSLNNLALLLQAQGDTAAARPYLERALAICEKALGPEHPNTRIVRGNLDDLGREEEAEAQRSKGAGEQGGGPAD